MSKLELRKLIFEARVENFLYIDRTGLFFKTLQEFIGIYNFIPNIPNTSFILSNKTFQGSLSPQNIALINIQPTSSEEFEPVVKKMLTKFPEVYEEPKLKRLGYRFVYFQEKNKQDTLEFLKRFYASDLEEKLLKDREGPDFLETEHIEIKYTLKIRDNFYFTFSAYSGEKVAEDENNPRKDMIQKGLAIDIDCYSTYDTENIKLDSNFIEKELPVFLNRSSQTAKTIIQNIQSSKG